MTSAMAQASSVPAPTSPIPFEQEATRSGTSAVPQLSAVPALDPPIPAAGEVTSSGTSIVARLSPVPAPTPPISLEQDDTSGGKPFYLTAEYIPMYRTHNISSDEPVLLANAIIRSIKTFGGKGPKVIDIGCADGGLTRRFASLFESITIFEPNDVLFSHAVSRLSRINAIKLQPHNKIFPPIDPVLDDNFDVAVVSHVLYHVDKAHWRSFFNAISRVLRIGGLCIVVIWNKKSQIRQFICHAAPDREKVYSAEDLLTHEGKLLLFESGLEIIEVKRIEPEIKAYSLGAAGDIFNFLLGSNRVPSEHALTEFEKQITAHGFKNSQSVITIRKREPR
jgi:SAM-dependent methyltransferase